MTGPANGSPWRAALLATAIGTDLIVCMVAGYGLGKLLQLVISPSRLWIVAGIMLGFALGIYTSYLLVKNQLEDKS